MYEVELKLRADHESLRERLDDVGADRIEHRQQIDTYYDAPHRNFAETDEAFRLREETRLDDDGQPVETTTKMTYKGPLVEQASKTREEFETALADADAAAGVFDGLGFEPAATVTKERERFDLDGYTVTLDQVDDLGSFVEVEREGAESEIEQLRSGAEECLRRLGLDPASQIRTSYLGLLLAEDTQE